MKEEDYTNLFLQLQDTTILDDILQHGGPLSRLGHQGIDGGGLAFQAFLAIYPGGERAADIVLILQDACRLIVKRHGGRLGWS